jgi:hypothetical protein
MTSDLQRDGLEVGRVQAPTSRGSRASVASEFGDATGGPAIVVAPADGPWIRLYVRPGCMKGSDARQI